MEKWSSDQCAGFLIQGFIPVLNPCVAPESTQLFVLPWLIKRVSGTPVDFVAKVNCLIVLALQF